MEALIRLAEQAGDRLRRLRASLATAESCTGGLIGHLITEVPGASAYYVGGVVAYSNEVKEQLLGVRRETLETHGAVSAQTAQEMAQGARRLFGCQYAVAVTGIAGPTGGTPEKPVGLTYIAVAAPRGVRVERFIWSEGRSENKAASARAALELLCACLGEEEQHGTHAD